MRLQLSDDQYLICHQYSGAVILVDARWWDHLGLDPIIFHDINSRLAYAADGSELSASLRGHGLLTEDEEAILKRLGFFLTAADQDGYETRIEQFANTKRSTRVTMIYFTPTVRCPMACIYCFENHDRSAPTKKELTAGDLRAIDHFIERYIAQKELSANQVSLVLFGGEPLVPSLKAFNESIFDLAAARGYSLDVVTSGVFFDSFYEDLFTRHSGLLREIDITLDGPPLIHNRLRPWRNGRPTYDVIRENVNKMLAAGLRVMVKTNLGRDTFDHLADLLDLMIAYGWFDSPYFLFTTNILRSFGMTDTRGQEISEAEAVLKIIEVFKSHRYRELLSKLRIESLKITDYLCNALNLLVLGGGGNKFDAYPKYAFCHPDDGTMMNISYDGNIYSCNWGAGKNHLMAGNIFDETGDSFCRKEPLYPSVVRKDYCRSCDLLTLCGGGCPIDKHEMGPAEYHKVCRDRNYKVLSDFLASLVSRGWLEHLRGRGNLRVLRDSFDFNYRYESRIERQRIL
jgi:uncharacterized protein